MTFPKSAKVGSLSSLASFLTEVWLTGDSKVTRILKHPSNCADGRGARGRRTRWEQRAAENVRERHTTPLNGSWKAWCRRSKDKLTKMEGKHSFPRCKSEVRFPLPERPEKLRYTEKNLLGSSFCLICMSINWINTEMWPKSCIFHGNNWLNFWSFLI